MTRLRLTFHSPIFSRGSYDDRPEIRPASIRGQLHWWFRALGGSAAEENAVFGSVHSKPVFASKIVVRVANVAGEIGEVATLPHKRGGQASPKWAYLPGSSCELLLSERLGGLDERLRGAFHRSLEAWLLLGTLGLRATRAGGSFDWRVEEGGDSPFANPPHDPEAYVARCREVVSKATLRSFLLPTAYRSAEEARVDVSDTIGGPGGSNDWDKLDSCNWPLGNVQIHAQKRTLPSSPKRKTSPLRFRIVKFPDAYRVAAVWDDRTPVTGNRPGDFEGVVKLLADRDKAIGRALSKRL